MIFSRAHIFLFASVIAVLSGCSQASGGDVSSDDDVSSPASDFPTLHLEQTSVMYFEGNPQEEFNYGKSLDTCRKAGVPITPIAKADVGKIGRQHITRTVEATRSSERVQEWSVDLSLGDGQSMSCQFRLEGTDELVIYTPDGKAYGINLRTHKGDVQEAGKPQLLDPTTYDSEEAFVDQAMGWKHSGDAVVADHNCGVWIQPGDNRLCVWNEGEKWGYSRSGVNALDADGQPSADSIVLEADPGHGTGLQLRTEVFTVGQSQGEAPFTVPVDVTLSVKN